jgi:succinate dehydrogenase / fumarate reductase, membrane anchor subunit
MSKNTGSLQSPLGQVRGLGSAKEGVGHWWYQRLTAIALAPLSVLFVWLVLHLLNADYDVVRVTIAQPFIAVLLMCFMVSLFYHGQLGLQTIIEDYIHHRAMEMTLLILVKFSALLFSVASVLAIARIALTNN